MNQQLFTPGTAIEATSSVELSISCRDLLDKDVFSRSDPMCVVYHQLFGHSEWVELIRTEVIWDCLNPDFVTKVVTDYRFEEEQLLKFEIYDIDDASTSLGNHDFLGFAECTLGQIVSAGHLSLTLPLAQDRSRGYSIAKNQHTKGRIILLAEELTELKEEATIVIEGHCLATSVCPCLFTPRIFYTLSKINESGNYTVIYKSESYPGENPTWKPLSLTMNRICNGDRDRVLLIQCWKEGSNGYHTDLGKYMTTFNKLAAMVGVTDGAYLTKNGEPNKTARLTVRSCKTSPIHTFVEYISNGTQIHCCFAIDFTASNGDPNQPDSLHYFSQVPNMPNPYEQAIQSVGDIIKDYDQSQNYAVYGFGARVPPSGIVSHKFSVNFNATPFVGGGIPGVLGAYRNCIRQVQLAGPTNFAPIINDVAKMALQNSNGQHYYVLLMITDGIINDMPMTKEAIVNASGLPLSIVIVGVGGADFDNMEELDGDTVRLSSNGKFAQRDIVQFIPYRDAYTWLATSCPQNSRSGNMHFAKVRLAQEVLAEIPGQLTSFMKSRGIAPLGRR